MKLHKQAIRLTAIFTTAAALLIGCAQREEPRLEDPETNARYDTYKKLVHERKNPIHCYGDKLKNQEIAIKNEKNTVAVGVVCNARLFGVRLKF